MTIGREDSVRMERAHVRAWPALRTAVVDGWLWRSSGGGSQRANSVSTIDYAGDDVAGSIDAVEARYRALGAAVRFHTFDETAPAGLADALRERGYGESEATVTMFKRIEPVGAGVQVGAAGQVEVVGQVEAVAQVEAVGQVDVPGQVERRDHAWAEWCDVYLGAITPSRRAVNREILSAVPRPAAFFGCRRDGRIVSTALCVIGFGCAVVECVATRPDARRQGGGRAVMAGLLSWAARQDADLIGLQVVEGNTQAVGLYRSLGFVPGATNRFWWSGGM